MAQNGLRTLPTWGGYLFLSPSFSAFKSEDGDQMIGSKCLAFSGTHVNFLSPNKKELERLVFEIACRRSAFNKSVR